MQGPTIPSGVEADHPLRRGFAEGYGIDSTLPDEMVQPDRSIRPHWQQYVSLLDELRPGQFSSGRELARRLIHQNGVTHNVYGDPDGMDRPWSLDFIPLLIPAAQWDIASEGLIQRARLLDRLLADLYGPMDTVFSGVLPPDLIWANPGFLRSCHGIR